MARRDVTSLGDRERRTGGARAGAPGASRAHGLPDGHGGALRRRSPGPRDGSSAARADGAGRRGDGGGAQHLARRQRPERAEPPGHRCTAAGAGSHLRPVRPPRDLACRDRGDVRPGGRTARRHLGAAPVRTVSRHRLPRRGAGRFPPPRARPSSVHCHASSHGDARRRRVRQGGGAGSRAPGRHGCRGRLAHRFRRAGGGVGAGGGWPMAGCHCASRAAGGGGRAPPPERRLARNERPLGAGRAVGQRRPARSHPRSALGSAGRPGPPR